MSHGEHKTSLGIMTLGALGVVFGDIGTSPIYAFRQTLDTSGTTLYDIYGVISLIFWSLMLVVTFKYLSFVLRADNNGEGGILSLFALLPLKIKRATKGARYGFLLLILLGTALLFGDGILTPAISVLSATEGVGVISPNLAHYSMPLTVVILVVLFAFQYKGSASIGKIFGPIILLWFVSIGYLGLVKVQEEPSVLKALSPYYAVEYIGHHGFHTFIILSSVILAITGAEALYADLGHFGKRPIRISWYFVVAPALVLNYLGQAVLAIQNPAEKGSLFFGLAPSRGVLIYLVVLATAATVIASQALITGVASLSRQAVKLGLFPRMKIVHTSENLEGQIYVPAINLFVGIGSIFLVLNFRTSAALANAYSFAISGTMVVTTLAFAIVAQEKLKWKKASLWFLIPIFLIIDLGFFLATVTKLLKGAWVPLLMGLGLTYLMWAWRKGQSALEHALDKTNMEWSELDRFKEANTISILSGVGVYLSSNAQTVPQALVSQVRNLHSIPEKIVIVTIVTADIPVVKAAPTVREVYKGVTQAIIYVGFQQTVSIPKTLVEHVISSDEEKGATYYLTDRKFTESPQGELSGIVEKTFAFLHRNASTASNYFGLPENRVISIGTQMDL
jgi:KUP system potassium uptake protein